MREVKSCGVLCLRNPGEAEFLLMRHANRYDLPKGHVEEGESELECAIRELQEETGISAEGLAWVEGYRFERSYEARYKRFNNAKVRKTVVVFAAWVPGDANITLTEHGSAEWHPWKPPHSIQEKTIDPLLADLDAFSGFSA